MPSLHKTIKNTLHKGFLLSLGLLIPFQIQAQTACHENPTNACLNINTITKDARLDYCSQKNFAELIANPLLKKENQNFNKFITKVHQDDLLDAEFLGKELVCEARKTHSCLRDICDFIATECRKQPQTANTGYEQVTANFDAQIERCYEIVGELNTLHKVQIETVLTQNTDRKIRTIQNEADSQGRTQAKEELHHRLADVIRQTNRFASKVTVFVEDPLTEDDLADYGEKQDEEREQESIAYQKVLQKRMLAQVEAPKNIPKQTIWQRTKTQFLSPRPLAPPDNTPPPPMLASPSSNSGTYTEPPLPSGPGGYSDSSLLPPLGTIPSPSSSYNTTGSFGSPSSSSTTTASQNATGTSATANAAGSGLGSIMEIPSNAIKKITDSLQIDRLLQNVVSIYIGQKLLAGKGPLEQALGSAGINFGLGVLTGSQSLTCTTGSAGCMGGFNVGALTSIGANAAQHYIASEIGGDNPLTAALIGQGLNGIFSGASASLQNMSLQNLSLQGIAGGIMSLPGQALSGLLGGAGGVVSDIGRLVEAAGNTGSGLLSGITSGLTSLSGQVTSGIVLGYLIGNNGQSSSESGAIPGNIEQGANQAGLSDSQIRAQLNAAGITVDKDNCKPNETTPNCTSLVGIKQALIDSIIEIKQSSDFPVEIIRGTEGKPAGENPSFYTGEEIHKSGYAIDIKMLTGDIVQKWLQQNSFRRCTHNNDTTRSCYTVRTSKGTLDFHFESSFGDPHSAGPHWHVEMQAELSDSQVRAQLNAAGITVDKDNCKPNETTPNCTSLTGIKQSLIDSIIEIKKVSDFPMEIIRGTEGKPAGENPSFYTGEKIHGSGYAIDIRITGDISQQWFQQNYYGSEKCNHNNDPTKSCLTVWTPKGTLDFHFETSFRDPYSAGPHWHVEMPYAGLSNPTTIEQQAQSLEITPQESLFAQNTSKLLSNLKAASIFDNFGAQTPTNTANVGSGNLIQMFENQMYNPTTTIPDGFFSDTNLDTSQALRAIPVSAASNAASNTAQQFINNGSGPVNESFLSGLRLDGIANALNGSFLTNVGGAYLANKLGDGDPIKTVIAQALIQNVMSSVLSTLGGATANTPSGTGGGTGGVPANPFGNKPGVVFTELKPLSGACKNPQTGEEVSSCRRTAQKEGYFFINGKPFKVVSGGVYQPHMPTGEYKFSPINGGEIFQTTTDKSMSVDSDGDGNRYGFRIGIAGKDRNGNWMENGSVWDPALGRNRTLIRIHSDGPNWFEQDSWLVKEEGYTVNGVQDANLGNAGCLSPIGDEETQKRFFAELQKAYQEQGHKTFEVRDCSPGSSSLGSGSGELQGDANGNVSQADLYNYTRNRVANSSLNGFVPSDGANYGITTGSPDQWANYFTSLAGRESSWNSGTVGDIGRFEGNSNGLFQLSPNDALNHGLQSTPFSMDQLRDPAFNTNAAIAITANLVRQDGVIASGNQGAARYWGPLQRGWNDITDYSSYRTDSNGAINGNTGNPLLDHLSGGGNSPQSAGCQMEQTATQSSPGSSGSGGTAAYGSYSSEKTNQQSGLSHTQAERKVRSGGVTTSSSGGCSDPTKPNCTSLAGVNESLLDALIEIKKRCNCDVVITGGTETGHSAGGMHGTGKAVDLRISHGITRWVEQNKSGTCSLYGGDSACYVITTSHGTLDFHQEDKVKNKHWHVEIKNTFSFFTPSKTIAFFSTPFQALKNFLIPTASAASGSDELRQQKDLFDQIHADNMRILKGESSEFSDLDKRLALRRINAQANNFNEAYNNIPYASLSSADNALNDEVKTKLTETTDLQKDGQWVQTAPTGLGGIFKALADAIQGIFTAFGNLFGAVGPEGGSALNRAETISGSLGTIGGQVPGIGSGIRCVGAMCEQGLNDIKRTGEVNPGSVIRAGLRTTPAGIFMGDQ